MTPFNSLLFFYVCAVLLVPAVLLGLFRQRWLKHYLFVFTILMLLTAFDTAEKRLMLALFFLFQTSLVWMYAKTMRFPAVRRLLWLFVAVSTIPLWLVKLSAVFEGWSGIHLLGVSYMTFRAVGVLIELHDGLITDLKLSRFASFLLFFPSVSSGPIDRYRRFVSDQAQNLTRDEYIELLRSGIWKIFWGAFFNFGVSSWIYAGWLAKIPESGLLNTLFYMYGYTFFLFFNFAGYSLMAIGTSYLLGIRLPENFRLPFLSKDLKDFWSRWHITLSTWLRDYIYTRFVRYSMQKEWFKDPRTGSYLGYVLTMMTMGFWHGLTLQYILYGAYHAVLMCVNDLLDTRWKKFKKLKKGELSSVWMMLITFHLFSFGLLIFSGRIF